MKYNDNGEWKDISVKASDTLPVGTIVDYNGTTVPSGWEEADDVVVLYSNDNGSNETITLNDSSANYTYIEIYYRNIDNYYGSVKVYNPSGKSALLNGMYIADGGYTVSQNKIVSISGTTISSNGTKYGETGFNGASFTYNNNNYIWITRVVGYK